MLDEDEIRQLGMFDSLSDPQCEFALQRRMRLTSRKAFVKEDCGKRASRAMLRKAAPLPGRYGAGDLVCFRREQGSDKTGTVWSPPSRIVGFEGKTVWVNCGGIMVATAMDKLRPLNSAEALAYECLNNPYKHRRQSKKNLSINVELQADRNLLHQATLKRSILPAMGEEHLMLLCR